MGELAFFLGLQVKQKEDGIFISQDKYLTKILKRFGFTDVKTASIPMETQKHFLKDEDGEEVDDHLYRLMIGSLKYLTSLRPDIMFASKTVNEEVQLQALVDGKKVIITESTVRRDLYLEDAEGVDCLPNATIFKHLTLMGAKTTTWNELSSTMASAVVAPPKWIVAEYRFGDAWERFSGRDNLISYMMEQAQQEQIPQFGEPIKPLADEAVLKERGDSLERAATTASSLEAKQVIGNIIKTRSKATLNEPNPQGTSSSSGPRCQDTMGDTIAQTRVLDLENTKTAQAQEITSLKLRVKKLEKKGGSRTHKLKRLYKVGRSARVISSDEASLGDQEDASKQGRKIDDIDKDAEITLVDETQGRYGDDLMFDTGVLDDEEVFAGQDMAEKEINVAEKEVSTADPVTTAGEVVTTASVEISTASPTETTITDDLTLAQTLIEIRSAKPKVKGVVIGEQSESTTRTRPQQLPSKDKGKAIMEEPEKPTKRKDQIRHDEEVAQRLQAQMQAELEEEDRLVRQREEEANIVSWDNVQAMIDADYQMAQQMQVEEQEKLSIKDIRRKEVRNICCAKKSVRRKRETTEVDEDKETYELQSLMKVIPDEEEVAVDAIPLATKPPSIVEFKILKEGKTSYFQIIRADRSSKRYSTFIHMLRSFDREDLETLWKLIKAKHGYTRLEEDYKRVLWDDLKIMFEPHVEDLGRIVGIKRLLDDLRVTDAKFKDNEKRWKCTGIEPRGLSYALMTNCALPYELHYHLAIAVKVKMQPGPKPNVQTAGIMMNA
ncbi:hypothetical protein Tco_0496579 [Tanacetum coccineum]